MSCWIDLEITNFILAGTANSLTIYSPDRQLCYLQVIKVKNLAKLEGLLK